jgi:hypothetical protein
VTVLGGVPTGWRTLDAESSVDSQWATVYRSLDIISPWAGGAILDNRVADAFMNQRIVPDIAETRRLGIEYMSVVFPGVSWHNGAGRTSNAPLNQIPRRCGDFYQHQVDNALKAGAGMLYTAMFDEVSETAIFKLAAHKDQEPVGIDLFALDADGCNNTTSDMYLRAAGGKGRATSKIMSVLNMFRSKLPGRGTCSRRTTETQAPADATYPPARRTTAHMELLAMLPS